MGHAAVQRRARPLCGRRNLAPRAAWPPGRRDAEGRWLLSLPDADLRELLMDILRHTPALAVLAPDDLREAVHQRLAEGLLLLGPG